MDTKRCCDCKDELPLEAFSWKSKDRGTRQARCQPCMREYAKNHYADNADKYKARSAVRNKIARKKCRVVREAHLETECCSKCQTTEDLCLTPAVPGATPVHVALRSSGTVDAVIEAIAASQTLCKRCMGKHYGILGIPHQKARMDAECAADEV
jgi:hypothetical protein